ncbi:MULTISPECIES: hypothetical protein [Nostocales]|uniref:Uncharacterized protein n=3 Tax=Nostocales TaxID=1161 RepID=A0A0C1QXX3_9CYAN|nr:hypothetical protein [Tolypothrix bouteillei]KAF3883859.1 hypothetical protein DA73_0400039825 [Tolypothrix bouteillei VB521301]
MRRYHNEESLDESCSNFSERSSYKLGRPELLMFLLLFVLGILVDSWFNHHQLPWQSPNVYSQVSKSASVIL